jgi:hypothetical protein
MELPTLYRWSLPGPPPHNILETIGNGCAFLDYDNDGFADLYLSGYRSGALLHNEQGRSFQDVSRAAGIPPQRGGPAAPLPT